jgi:glycosyltransferase involved in cell wall biosynthesis
MNKISSISLFFPAYNEEKNIGESITKALDVLKQITSTYEIIVVNDGSKDNTSIVVNEFAKNNSNVRLIEHQKNKGYGEGLKSGISAARYEYIFFTDSDLQFDLNELKIFIGYVPEYDMVVGYRKNRSDHIIRLVNAKLWNVANRILFGLKIRDMDCAFKLFRRDLAQNISLTTGGAMTSVEIFIKFKDLGAKIKELPVTHLPRKAGFQTGANLNVILRAFNEMFKVFLVRNGWKK